MDQRPKFQRQNYKTPEDNTAESLDDFGINFYRYNSEDIIQEGKY